MPNAHPEGLESMEAFFDQFVANRKRIPTLAEVRTQLDITQKRMAELCGVSIRTYCYWENGHYAPRIGSRRKLMKALGLSFDRHRELFGESPWERRARLRVEEKGTAT